MTQFTSQKLKLQGTLHNVWGCGSLQGIFFFNIFHTVVPSGYCLLVVRQKRLRWSRGKRAGLWYPSSQVQTRPKPSDFSGEKILSAPSFGGEVKLSVPCRKFTAYKRTQKWRGSRHFQQNSRQFLAHSSTFRCWGSLTSFQMWGTPGGGSWNVIITGPPGWVFDVPLATVLCKNLPDENTQR